MISLESQLIDQERDLIHSKNELAQLQFTFGGNWEYDRGSFDKYLDDGRTIWLRLPFDIVQGEMDAEVRDTEARIRFGQPFVLRHLYETGLDDDAKAQMAGALVNQFQEPFDKDAEVDEHWVQEAQTILRNAERVLQ